MPAEQGSARPRQLTATDLLDAPVERVIAHGRLLLCLSSMLIVALASSPPQDAATSTLLLAYTLYAVLLALVTRRWRPSPRARSLIHAGDIAVAALLMLLAKGPASPFFALFVFVLLAATLRWNWHGVVLTALLLAFTLGSGSQAPGLAEASHLNSMLQGIYLGMAGAMLAYVSAYLEHQRSRLVALAEWPDHDAALRGAPNLTNTLAHTARVLNASRLLVVWEADEEPFTTSLMFSRGAYEESREVAGVYEPLVAPSLSSATFARDDGSTNIVLASGSEKATLPVINGRLEQTHGIKTFATAPIAGKLCRGRVFVLDQQSWNENQLVLTRIVASRITMELDRQLLQLRTEQNATLQERARLSQDLHDGLLQSLAAAGMQAKLASDAKAGDYQSRLATIRDLLLREQRRLRSFINEIRPHQEAAEQMTLAGHMHELLSQLARYWNCAASLQITPIDAKVPQALLEQLFLVLDEAISNAVRHGEASRVEVLIHRDGKQMRIQIRDNGRGFAAADGVENNGTAAEIPAGPSSLRDRVSRLGGALTVHSSPFGAELDIGLTVP